MSSYHAMAKKNVKLLTIAKAKSEWLVLLSKKTRNISKHGEIRSLKSPRSFDGLSSLLILISSVSKMDKKQTNFISLLMIRSIYFCNSLATAKSCRFYATGSPICSETLYFVD